jgi:hypothetical protein
MDLGDPVRVIEVTPTQEPIPDPMEMPEFEPAEETEEVPA